MISEKDKSNALHYLAEIDGKRFDQNTLAMLLLALRQSANKDSLTREIGDFVAHADRERGLVSVGIKDQGIKTAMDGGRLKMHVKAAACPAAKCLTDDLIRELRASSLDAGCIDRNRDELVLCYFGILHLSTVKLGTGNMATLKLSDRFATNRDGSVRYLSIIALKPGWIAQIFYSEINATDALGNVPFDNNDRKTLFRAVRQNEGVRLIRD